MLNVFGRRDACLRQPHTYPKPQEVADALASEYRETDTNKPLWIDDDYEEYRYLYTSFLLALTRRDTKDAEDARITRLELLMDELCKNGYVLAQEGRLQGKDVESVAYGQLLQAMIHQPSPSSTF